MLIASEVQKYLQYMMSVTAAAGTPHMKGIAHVQSTGSHSRA